MDFRPVISVLIVAVPILLILGGVAVWVLWRRQPGADETDIRSKY
jgi:hypothetical protein